MHGHVNVRCSRNIPLDSFSDRRLTGQVFMVYSCLLGEFCGVAFKQASLPSNNHISPNVILLLKLKQRRWMTYQSARPSFEHTFRTTSLSVPIRPWSFICIVSLPLCYLLTVYPRTIFLRSALFFRGFYAE